MKRWTILGIVFVVGLTIYFSGVTSKIISSYSKASTAKEPTQTEEENNLPTQVIKKPTESAPTEAVEDESKDKNAPVIEGWVGESSYFNDLIFMTVYPDKEYDFSKYITATDDQDPDVSIEADLASIDLTKDGVNNVTVYAEDKSGNISETEAKVEVRLPKKIDQMADELLGEIIQDSMTDVEKAKAIYVYIRKNVSYADNYEETDWEKAAEYAMKYNSGDCFAYYSMARILLTRAGIPNIMVTRYRGEGHHWWNLVYVEGGWYHFDSTPRHKQATFCLVTSDQLAEYSSNAGDTHLWDVPKYPQTATKAISEVEMGKRY